MRFYAIALFLQKLALHPRTSALAELAYACHGLFAAHHWVVVLIYSGLFVVSMAHLIWATVSH